MLTIFYVTDIHGSEICWRKFLNAGAFYKADVVIVGGDITGKAMVPVVARNGKWDTVMFERHEILDTEDEVVAIEQRSATAATTRSGCRRRLRPAAGRPGAVEQRFTKVMLDETQRWLQMADDKLRDKVHRVIVCPANDDMFELDALLNQKGRVVETNDRRAVDLEGFEMVSLGWTNPTPWNTFRELPEEELRQAGRRDRRKVNDPTRDLQLPRPAVRAGLDQAPALDENLNIKAGGRRMRPVGSTSIRTAIEARAAAAGAARSHPREPGATRIGRTLALNPGSTYEEGVLQGALVTLDSKKAKVKNYVLVNG